jgi:hypothetical protein
MRRAAVTGKAARAKPSQVAASAPLQDAVRALQAVGEAWSVILLIINILLRLFSVVACVRCRCLTESQSAH